MKKMCLSLLAGFVTTLILLPKTAVAAEGRSFGQAPERPLIEQVTAGETALTASPVHSSNANGNYYTSGHRWQTPVDSYFYANEGGGLTRVEHIGNRVVIEDYDGTCNLLAQTELAMELPLWGGFYAGNTSNFLVFGQQNQEESNQREVIRVVKYSKNWERQGAASLYGANTTIPFEAGSLRMAEYGNMLYIRTCHEMYTKKEDGLNHQANLSFTVDTSKMSIAGQTSAVMNEDVGYSSHSFNQFILVDKQRVIALDHGDAYPRSIAMFRYHQKAGGRVFSNTFDENCDWFSLLPIQGETGDNDTGVAIGAMEASATAYLVAGNSIPQYATSNYYGQRNIFVSSTAKNRFGKNGTTMHWITNYTDTDKVTLSPPHLVKIFDHRFLLLFSEGKEVKYAFLDGEGNMTSPMYSMEAYLSDCKPVAYQGVVVWYYTRNSEPVFCVIDSEGNGFKLNAYKP